MTSNTLYGERGMPSMRKSVSYNDRGEEHSVHFNFVIASESIPTSIIRIPVGIPARLDVTVSSLALKVTVRVLDGFGVE